MEWTNSETESVLNSQIKRAYYSFYLVLGVYERLYGTSLASKSASHYTIVAL